MPANVETMAYVGQTPWHGLGNPVQKDATIEQIRDASGLNYPVHRAQVKFDGPDGQLYESRDHVIFRMKDGKPIIFDTVGPTYQPFQHDQILDFFREYVESGEAYIETAGALGQGQTVWALAKMEDGFTLGEGDRVEGFILISNPHQYGKGCTVKFTSVRVVCANTLAMAIGGKGPKLVIPHNREFNEAYRQDAKKRLGIAREQLHAFQADAEQLVKVSLAEEDALEIYEAVFPEQPKVHDAVMGLYLGAGRGAGLETANGTAWGALNAVTEYYDWHAGRTQDNRVRSAWYGHGAARKQQTLTELLRRAGVERKN